MLSLSHIVLVQPQHSRSGPKPKLFLSSSSIRRCAILFCAGRCPQALPRAGPPRHLTVSGTKLPMSRSTTGPKRRMRCFARSRVEAAVAMARTRKRRQDQPRSHSEVAVGLRYFATFVFATGIYTVCIQRDFSLIRISFPPTSAHCREAARSDPFRGGRQRRRKRGPAAFSCSTRFEAILFFVERFAKEACDGEAVCVYVEK